MGLGEKVFRKGYIDVVNDMDEGVFIAIRSLPGETNEFPIMDDTKGPLLVLTSMP